MSRRTPLPGASVDASSIPWAVAGASRRAGRARGRSFPGVVAMTEARYRHLASLAGSWLLEPRAVAYAVSEDSGGEERAVYIAVNDAGLCCYAGQSRPRPDGRSSAHRRMRAHLREPVKAAEWSQYWVLPLRHDTPGPVIDELEDAVCARLGVPLRNTRWRRVG